jgi:hypothetical protein
VPTFSQARDPFGPGVDSFSRMQVVLENYPAMKRAKWFAQLGDAWTACDNLSDHRQALRAILGVASRSELDAMMDARELSVLAALPTRLEVWRGCYARNRAGLSWTLDPAVARRHVTLNRYTRQAVPVLRRGFVRRDRAVLKLDRRESEVIAAHVFGITEEPFLP